MPALQQPHISFVDEKLLAEHHAAQIAAVASQSTLWTIGVWIHAIRQSDIDDSLKLLTDSQAASISCGAAVIQICARGWKLP